MANLLCTDTELQTVANAIRSKGNTSAALGFPTGMKNAIDALNVGANLSPAAAAGDIRNGKKAVVNRQTITGSMSEKAAATYNTSSSDQSIAANQYLTGAQTIKAVTTSNIDAGNIKTGVVIKVGDANSAGRIKNVTGTFTADANASAGYIWSGKTAYVNGSKITGTLKPYYTYDYSVTGSWTVYGHGRTNPTNVTIAKSSLGLSSSDDVSSYNWTAIGTAYTSSGLDTSIYLTFRGISGPSGNANITVTFYSNQTGSDNKTITKIAGIVTAIKK